MIKLFGSSSRKSLICPYPFCTNKTFASGLTVPMIWATSLQYLSEYFLEIITVEHDEASKRFDELKIISFPKISDNFSLALMCLTRFNSFFESKSKTRLQFELRIRAIKLPTAPKPRIWYKSSISGSKTYLPFSQNYYSLWILMISRRYFYF